MKLTKKIEKEAIEVYDIWLHSYLNGDVKTYNSFLDEEYHFIGSTANEEFLNRKATTKFFKDTADQLAGKTEIKNKIRTIEYFDGLVFITEVFDAYFMIEKKWNYYGRFRFTSVLRNRAEGWRFIYQHFSMPDSKAEDGETLGAEQVSKENQELKDAIKRRTAELQIKNRELEIEASLEQVRSRSLAMHSAKELGEVVAVIVEKLKDLGVVLDANGVVLCTYFDDSKDVLHWIASPDYTFAGSYLLPYFDHPIFNDAWQTKENGDAYFSKAYTVEEKNSFFAYAFEHSDYKHFPDDFKQWVFQNDQHILSFAWQKKSAILIPSHTGVVPSEDDIVILKRFAKVFEQTYTRFLDLQKAEAQAREAQIEAALERVRSQSMGMQTSEDLSKVTTAMFEQLRMLGGDLYATGIVLCDKHKNHVEQWHSVPGAGMITPFIVPINLDRIHQYRYDQWKKGVELFSVEIEEDFIEQHFSTLFELPSVKTVLKDFEAKRISMPTPAWEIDYGASFKYGYLLVSALKPFEEKHILPRFAKAFEQTYTRFLELKKAEAQTREAQIEAALERVRARTMSMQKSDELSETASEIFKQIQTLGINPWSFGFNIFDHENKTIDQWVSSAENQILPPFKTPSNKDVFIRFTEAAQKEETLFVEEIGGEALKTHYKYMSTLPVLGDVFNKMEESGIKLPTFQVFNVAFFSQGYLMFITYEQVPGFHAIFKRFAKVFEQTYTRFLDLKQAEAQAREAQIEAALERVRSKAMAMHNSENLLDTIGEFFVQLKLLNIIPVRCGVAQMFDDPPSWVAAATNSTIQGESVQLSGKVDSLDHPVLKGIHYHWIKQENYFPVLQGEDIKDYYKALRPQINIPKFTKGEVHHGNYFNFQEGNIFAWTKNPLSEDEKSIFVRFSSVLSLTYRRYLDLRESEKQAKEAKVEAALEKVRSWTMGMQKSIELPDAANNLFLEVQKLGIPAWSAGYCIWEKDKKSATAFMSSEGVVQKPFSLPIIGEGYNFQEPLLNGESFLVAELGGEGLKKHYEFMQTLPIFGEVIDGIINAGFSLPTFQIFHIVFFKHGYLMFITYEPVPDAHDIFKRFTKVFEQTYTRFLDLHKAEAQTRETQVELSLERIRAQVTAMSESSDLLDIVVTMRTEFLSLGHEAHYFWYMRWLTEIYEKAMTSGDGTKIGMIMSLPRHIHGDIKLVDDWEKSDEPALVFAMDVETAVDYIDKMITLGDFVQVDPSAPSLDDIRHIGGLTFIMARTQHGEIGFSLPGCVPNPPQDSLDTLVRFAGVFDLAYRRFEDLKNAEYRNRETQIELALERSRNQSMLMQHSDELNKTSQVFHEQLELLGIESEFSYLWLPNETKKEHLFHATWHETTKGDIVFKNKEVTYPLDKTEPSIAACYTAWESGERVHVNPVAPAEVKDYFATWDELLHGVDKFKPELFPDGIYYVDAYMKYGCFGIMIKRLITDEEKKTLSRFAVEFERAYTRFLDLKKSEGQTRKAKIETALERVRARAMAMQKPEELKEVAEVLRNEMGLLGVEELETCSIYINDKNKEQAECWYALKDIRESGKKLVVDHFLLNLNDTWVGHEMLKFYKSSEKQVSIVMTGKPRLEWIRYCEEKSVPFSGYYGEVIPDRTYHLYKFSHGAIGAATPGGFSEENWGLLKKAASVFSLAYSRFNDLTKARYDLQQLKEEKKRAENALTELRSTQSQLIHAEKMASLGELTAGIAHEIQNPLNFVNNFSEVNAELITELNEEIDNGDLEEVKVIAKDIAENEEKIMHHGKRAEGIVKSMLQHSRGSGNDKQKTDLNALADEYLRLSYHGLRAKDKSFNADFILNADESLPKVNVIAQDIGRVLLNLINNAFYAVSAEASAQAQSDYKPTVIVSTKQKGDSIEIRVRDNGHGIPPDVKTKIFQPFFTTKPTGQGTGLGLSMSYDIITKGHQGELKVETKAGEFTEFVINLPI